MCVCVHCANCSFSLAYEIYVNCENCSLCLYLNMIQRAFIQFGNRFSKVVSLSLCLELVPLAIQRCTAIAIDSSVCSIYVTFKFTCMSFAVCIKCVWISVIVVHKVRCAIYILLLAEAPFMHLKIVLREMKETHCNNDTHACDNWTVEIHNVWQRLDGILMLVFIKSFHLFLPLSAALCLQFDQKHEIVYKHVARSWVYSFDDVYVHCTRWYCGQLWMSLFACAHIGALSLSLWYVRLLLRRFKCNKHSI